MSMVCIIYGVIQTHFSGDFFHLSCNIRLDRSYVSHLLLRAPTKYTIRFITVSYTSLCSVHYYTIVYGASTYRVQTGQRRKQNWFLSKIKLHFITLSISFFVFFLFFFYKFLAWHS